jgi:hypothetical protein
MSSAWAIPYKNPLAMIQRPADDWQGLKGSDNGKLQFDTMPNGVRAGVINLYNAYFKRGKNTLRTIFAAYAPKGHGANDPLNYANIVSQKIGVGIDQTLEFEKVVSKLSRAIIQVESGSDISDLDFKRGLTLALDKLGFTILEGGTYTEIVVTGKKKKPMNWWWLLPIIVGGGLLIYNKRK